MGQPKYTLKLKPNNYKARNKIQREIINERENQLNKAVEWCKENGTRGWSAVKSGMFPLIKDRRTINKRLDGEIQTGEEKSYCSILTNEEENSIVRFLKNKNRCFQGLNKAKTTAVILDALRLRSYYNKKYKGGRRFVNLSSHAKTALQNKKLGRSFWERWDAKHPSLVKKRQGTISTKRALNCTEEMAENHLDELASELIKIEIFKNAKKIGPGEWSGNIDLTRIFNHGETPQFVNYGVDRTPTGLVFAGRGSSCKKLIQDNRECISIDPFISLSGDVILCHVIFKSKGMTSDMAPPGVVKKIDRLFISSTENGYQTHSSLLDTYKFFNDKYLVKHKIQKPVALLSDGQSSRFDDDVLRYCKHNDINLFLSSPETTGITQLLDQINQNLHSHYRKENLFLPTQTINKERFMEILGDRWNEWATPNTILNAAKKVGITSTILNKNFMQVERFAQAEEIMEVEENDSEENLPSSSLINSPVKLWRNSTLWYKKKLEDAVQIIDSLRNERLIEEAGLLKINQIRHVEDSRKSI